MGRNATHIMTIRNYLVVFNMPFILPTSVLNKHVYYLDSARNHVQGCLFGLSPPWYINVEPSPCSRLGSCPSALPRDIEAPLMLGFVQRKINQLPWLHEHEQVRMASHATSEKSACSIFLLFNPKSRREMGWGQSRDDARRISVFGGKQ